MQTEKEVERDILVDVANDKKTELFRNNVGVLKSGVRWVRFGLGKGSSDYIGYTTIKITEAMVGKNVAVFVACEVKRVGGKTTPEQDAFMNKVNKAGGVAFVADSLVEYVRRMKAWKTNLKRRTN
jgi:hypothetical protein